MIGDFLKRQYFNFNYFGKNEMEIWGFVEDVRSIKSYNDVLGKSK
jgi:hypothetical protein